MKSKSFDGMTCSIAGVLEAIGDRWAVLILRDLSLGLRRYEDLRHSTGVTNATLADRLKHLEDHGLIERRRYQTNPERYEYVLTAKGRDTILVMQALLQVGDKWAVSGNAGPPAQLRRSKDRAPGEACNGRQRDRSTCQSPGPAAASRSGRRRADPLAFDAFPEIACHESGLREKQAAAFADEMTIII